MIDFIKATKHLQYEDSIFLGHLQLEASYNIGWKKYLLPGCKKLDIWYNEARQLIQIKGSIPYFLQGHNFNFDNCQFVEAINYIGDMLQVNLFDSIIDEFEYGIIIPVKERPRNYIQNHRENTKQKLQMNDNPQYKGSCRIWKNKYLRLKMYDAGTNILHKQGMKMREVIKATGWNPEGYYLKIEAHYNNPHIIFNNGVGFTLGDLVNPSWQEKFNTDLYKQYKKLTPMGMIEQPKDKKDLSTPDILMITLAEEATQRGKTIKEIQKMLYDKINEFPDEILSPNDKKARKRKISETIRKIQILPESRYDLSNKLEEALSVKEQEDI